MPHQFSIAGRQDFFGGAIGQLDKSVLANSYDRGRAGFYQNPESLLGLQAEAPVAHQLSHEQAAADDR